MSGQSYHKRFIALSIQYSPSPVHVPYAAHFCISKCIFSLPGHLRACKNISFMKLGIITSPYGMSSYESHVVTLLARDQIGL
jgi:hypothetical protein